MTRRRALLRGLFLANVVFFGTLPAHAQTFSVGPAFVGSVQADLHNLIIEIQVLAREALEDIDTNQVEARVSSAFSHLEMYEETGRLGGVLLIQPQMQQALQTAAMIKRKQSVTRENLEQLISSLSAIRQWIESQYLQNLTRIGRLAAYSVMIRRQVRDMDDISLIIERTEETAAKKNVRLAKLEAIENTYDFLLGAGTSLDADSLVDVSAGVLRGEIRLSEERFRQHISRLKQLKPGFRFTQSRRTLAEIIENWSLSKNVSDRCELILISNVPKDNQI